MAYGWAVVCDLDAERDEGRTPGARGSCPRAGRAGSQEGRWTCIRILLTRGVELVLGPRPSFLCCRELRMRRARD
jgi:hypothetical protein